MGSKVLAALVAVSALTLAACATVKGVASDINSAANCTENAIKSGYCK